MSEEIIALSNILQNSNKIVFLGGAGVSTESGIPDFRSENGIYRTMEKYGHPPEKILSRTYFDEHTEDFYRFYRDEMIHEECEANKAHKALVELEQMDKLSAVITQNIDGLHQLAGSNNVLELHGSIYRNYCMTCGKSHDLKSVVDSENIPKCVACGGVVKPDVVLYEEGLDDEILQQSVMAVANAEVLIIGGTSLNVYPAAGLIQYFKGKALVLINKSKTAYDKEADLLIYEDIGNTLAGAIDLMKG